MQVESSGVHGEVAAGVFGPLAFGAIPVELDTVVVGIVEVEGLADAVVGGSVEGDVGGEEAVQSVGQCCAGGIEDGEVVEAGGSGRWRRAAEALPGVEADVVVVVTCGEECGRVADVLGDLEAENAVVEGEGAVEVGYAEMDVGRCGFGDGWSRSWIGSWCGKAVGGWRFVGAGVESYFPLAVYLLPEGDVTTVEGGGFAVLGDGGGVVVTPGEAGVVGGAHLRSFGVPAELVLGGIPVGDGGDGGSAQYSGLAVVEGYAVVGEPRAEGSATAVGDGCGELTFELEELEDSWRELGRWHGDEDMGWRLSCGCGRRDALAGGLGVHGCGDEDACGAEQKGFGESTHGEIVLPGSMH